MADSSVIDPQAIAELRSLNPGDNDEFLREIAGIFLDDTPHRIAELDQSLAAGDVPAFARAAHSIKGSSSNLGAIALRAAAESLEQTARGAGLAGAAPGVVTVKSEFARARTELTSLLARRESFPSDPRPGA
jgi:HPt (histidine-containing phosphotransfer) domain-containing protein